MQTHSVWSDCEDQAKVDVDVQVEQGQRACSRVTSDDVKQHWCYFAVKSLWVFLFEKKTEAAIF